MHSRKNVLPYLTRFAVQRTEIESIGGWYSQETAMWMLNTENGPQPAIECDSASLEMLTKTEIKSESDDDNVLELLTKTMVQNERDDDEPSGWVQFQLDYVNSLGN